MKRYFLYVAAVLVFLFGAALGGGPVKDERVDIKPDDFIERIDFDDSVNEFSVFLTIDCDWNNLTTQDQLKIARYVIEKCDNMSYQSGIYAQAPVWGFNDAKMIFNRVVLIREGKTNIKL